MRVTVGIKALNEEKNIANAIRTSLLALEPFTGEVILADSGSSDATIAIAQQFPVKIFQLANTGERCCGAGAQLAFQHVDADYFYLLDGDMTLHPDFLKLGVEYLQTHTDIAAVGGHVREQNVEAAEFQIRANNLERDGHWKPGLVDRLDCGGLYRVSAIRQVSYFADSNLHSFEEFELGARLRSVGWKLARIDAPAVDHFGHTRRSYDLLWQRLKSGYMSGAGEVLLGALGNKHLPIVLRDLSHVRNGLIIVVWWLLLLALLFVYPVGSLLLLVTPVVFLAWRRKSVALGIFSFVSWNVAAWGLLAGLLRKRRSPSKPISSVELQSVMQDA